MTRITVVPVAGGVAKGGRESATIAFAWHHDQRLIACQTQEL
ncbi:MAG TPA: hypothetical protein VK956_11975 [Verrucomicrobium sp.]|nr:hypothetical protein [Verrucomicrobium sp.]